MAPTAMKVQDASVRAHAAVHHQRPFRLASSSRRVVHPTICRAASQEDGNSHPTATTRRQAISALASLGVSIVAGPALANPFLKSTGAG